MNEPQEARKKFEKALEKDPSDNKAALFVAHSLYADRKCGEALERYQEATEAIKTYRANEALLDSVKAKIALQADKRLEVTRIDGILSGPSRGRPMVELRFKGRISQETLQDFGHWLDIRNLTQLLNRIVEASGDKRRFYERPHGEISNVYFVTPAQHEYLESVSGPQTGQQK